MRLLRRFRRNRTAAAALEFALVAPVFLALLFAILETALTPPSISEVYVDTSLRATVQWSKSAIIQANAATAALTTSARNRGDDVTSVVPSQLLVAKTYLIFSEVSYRYIPTIGYVMGKTGVNMSDVSCTRPRQAACIVYNNVPVLVTGRCPQT